MNLLVCYVERLLRAFALSMEMAARILPTNLETAKLITIEETGHHPSLRYFA